LAHALVTNRLGQRDQVVGVVTHSGITCFVSFKTALEEPAS
jgi:hypothetical protein